MLLMFSPYLTTAFPPDMELLDAILSNSTVDNWGDWYKGLSQPVEEALREVTNVASPIGH